MEGAIVNKVSESGLITLNLEQYLPAEEPLSFDLAPFLFMGQILKEKDFRASLLEQDWTVFRGRNVAVFCSADAIIPAWAYMLAASYLQAYAHSVHAGKPEEVQSRVLIENLRKGLHGPDYTDMRVVVKGCGDKPVGMEAYLEVTNILRPHVKNLMYGEPCSTVPVFKKKAG
jgi:hypothetical protein